MASQANFDNLVKWFRHAGGYLNESLERRPNQNGIYGFYAQKPIAPEQVLVKVPDQLVIGPDVNSGLPNWNKMVKIIYNVAVEKRKGPDSFFELAFKVLPTLENYREYHPFFMSAEEQAGLEKIYDHSRLFKQSYQSELTSIIELIQKFQGDWVFSDAEITWAYFVYKTRAWGDGVIPVLDMFNHSNNLGAMKINKTEPTLGSDGQPISGQDGIKYHLIVSRVDYYPGDQVYLSYGNKDNFRLAYDYGFQDPNNMDLVVPIQVNYSGSTPLHFAISQLLMARRGMTATVKDNTVQPSIYCEYTNYYQETDQRGLTQAFTENGVSDNLIQLFRTFAIENYSELEAGQGQISRALKLIKTYAQDMLKGVSLTAVNKELEKDHLSDGYRTCLLTIKRRIIILRKCLEWIEKRHQALLE